MNRERREREAGVNGGTGVNREAGVSRERERERGAWGDQGWGEREGGWGKQRHTHKHRSSKQ